MCTSKEDMRAAMKEMKNLINIWRYEDFLTQSWDGCLCPGTEESGCRAAATTGDRADEP